MVEMVWLLVCVLCAVAASKDSGAITQSFQRDGCSLSRGLLSENFTLELAPRLRSLLREHTVPHLYSRPFFFRESGRKEFSFASGIDTRDEQVAEFLATTAGPLWRTATLLANGSELCFLTTRAFSKEPGDLDTHWHRDDDTLGVATVDQKLRTLHAWIPLHSMRREMGTLRYVPGSHRWLFAWIDRPLSLVSPFLFKAWASSDVTADGDVCLGDVAWHDGKVLHAAGANDGDDTRDGFTVSFAYCDAGACGDASAPVSASDPTCRISSMIFDKAWMAKRSGGTAQRAILVGVTSMLIMHLGVSKF